MGAELNPEKFTSASGATLLATIQNDWPRAEAAFQQLRDFIENQLKLYSDKVVRSYGSFIPIFDYLYQNPKPEEGNRLLMRAYYYKSQLFNWYGSRTDNLINVMHGINNKAQGADFPLAEIKSYFDSSRQLDTELKPKHLTDIRIRYIILNLIYVERFGASPFNVRYKGNEPHIDHIYPQSALRNQLGLGTELPVSRCVRQHEKAGRVAGGLFHAVETEPDQHRQSPFAVGRGIEPDLAEVRCRHLPRLQRSAAASDLRDCKSCRESGGGQR
jgi:hypothetical protein